MADITGTNGGDPLDGTPTEDTIKSGAGNDTINAEDGADVVTAGAGDDFVRGGDGDDTIAGFDGNDTISGGGGADAINAGAGNDHVNAGRGDDSIEGGEGSDVLKGGEGADTFFFRSLRLDAGDVDYITDFSVGDGDSLVFSGCSVVSISQETLGIKKFGDYGLDNSSGKNDLKLVLAVSDGLGGTYNQEIWLIDSVNSSETMAFWHTYFGV